FPEFGHEQHPQRARMPQQLLEFGNRAAAGRPVHRWPHGLGGIGRVGIHSSPGWKCARGRESAEDRPAAGGESTRDQATELPEWAPAGGPPMLVRTSNSSGKNVRSSACFRKPTPLEPPVPRLKPMIRITVRM